MSSVVDGSPRVLIADDDALVRFVVRAALEGDGWTVVEADSSWAAIRTLESLPADVAIVDSHMPGDGLARLLEQMNGLETPPPVIVMSGAPVSAEVLSSYGGARSGSTGAVYLAKPVELSTLRDTVRRLAADNAVAPGHEDGVRHADA